MSDTLKDQLMGLGFKPAPKPEKPARPEHKPGGASAGAKRSGDARSDGRRHGRDASRRDAPRDAGGHGRRDAKSAPRSQEEIDLAKAYALRAVTEKREREAAERAKQEAARVRREAKAALDAFLAGKPLNDATAELARHFPYGGKIKRIHVTPDQLKALNSGELGVVQSNGRYLLVTAAVLVEARGIFPEAIALEVDPNAPSTGEEYGDPQYTVPDDLVW